MSLQAVVSAEFQPRSAILAVEAGTTVARLLAHAVRQGLIRREQLPLVDVWIDGDRLDPHADAARMLQAHETIHLNVTVHGGGGGGQKDIGQILLQIAVIAIATWVGGPGGAAAAMGIKAGTALAFVVNAAASAAVMALGGLAIQALYAPERENQARANDRYALQTASNQYRPWGPMPLLLGRQVVAPDLAVKGYTQTIGEDVWLYGILGVHYGPVAVSDLKIGDTSVASMGEGEVRLAYHLTPGPRTWSIYPNTVDEAQFSEELNEDGATALIRAAGDVGERFEFDFVFPRGLWFNKTSNGKSLDEDVVIQVQYRPINAQGDPTGAWAPAPFPAATRYTGAALPPGSLYFRNKVKEVWRVTRSLTLPEGLYEFAFTRDVPDDGPDGGGVEQVMLTAIRAIRFTPPITDETLSVIEFAVKATAMNQGTLAPITLTAEPICDVWDGETWGTPEPTSNPAALSRWLVTGPAAAKPLPSHQADLGLGYWYEICAERGWDAGLRIAEPRSQADVLQLLGQRGRAAPYWSGRALEASPFVSKLAPRQLFTGANLSDHGWRIAYPEPVHALRVEFQNLDQGGEPDEVVVYVEGYGPPGPGLDPELEPAVRVETFRIEGQCTIERAWRDGRWELAERRHRRRVDSWTCDIDHLACRLGDRVRLSWLGIRKGLGQGRVRCRRWAAGLVRGVRLDQPVEMEAGKTYAIDARRVEGLATAIAVQTTPGLVRELIFAEPLAPEDAPVAGDLIAFGEAGQVSEDVEILAIEPQENFRARLTGIRYVGDVLDALDQLPVPEDLVTGVSGARRARPPAPRLVAAQADPDGVRIAFSVPPWSGSPVTGFTARWRWTPPDPEAGDDQAAAWQRLPALGADARQLVTPPVRALPSQAGDDEAATLVDVEIVTTAASGAVSEPLLVTAIEVRSDPFPPVVTDVGGRVRPGRDGSSMGVLYVEARPLEAGAQSDLIVQVREREEGEDGAPTGDWRTLGSPLPADAPAGDFLDVAGGQTYGVRTKWRTADGWSSAWTDEEIVQVPANANVSADTANVGQRPVLDVLADLEAAAQGVAALQATAAALSETIALLNQQVGELDGQVNDGRAQLDDMIARTALMVARAQLTAQDLLDLRTRLEGVPIGRRLVSEIERVDGAVAGVVQTVQVLATETESATQQLDLAISTVGDNLAAVQTQTNTLASDLSAATSSLTIQISNVGNTVAQHASLITTNANAIQAEVNTRTSQVASLNASVAAVESSVSTVASNLAAETTTRSSQVSSLDGRVAAVETTTTTLATDLLAETTTRTLQISQVEDAIGVLSTSQTTLSDGLSALTTSVSSQFSAVNGTLAALQSSLTTVSDSLQAETQARQTAISSVQGSIGALSDTINTVASELEAATQQLTEHISTTGDAVAALTTQTNTLATGLSAETQTRETQISALGTSVSAVQTQANTIATDVAANASRTTAIEASLVANPNLIDNPSGQKGLDGWADSDEIFEVLSNAQVPAASYFSAGEPGTSTAGWAYLSFEIEAGPGTYTASWKAFREGLTGSFIAYFEAVNVANASTAGAITYSAGNDAAATGLTGARRSMTFTAGAGTTRIRVVFAINGAWASGYAEVGILNVKCEAGDKATLYNESGLARDVAARLAVTEAVQVDLEGRTTAYWDLVAAAGGDPAHVRVLADGHGSEIAMAATMLLLLNISNGQLVEALKLVGGEAYFGAPVSVDVGGKRLTIGPGFGAASDLVLWFGPNTTAIADMTKTNGRFAIATDGEVYYGAATLADATASGGFRIGYSPAARTVVISGSSGTMNTPTITLTAQNAAGAVSYSISKVTDNHPTGWTITQPGGAGTWRWSRTVAPGEDFRDTWLVTGVDGDGNVATVLVPVILVKNSLS